MPQHQKPPLQGKAWLGFYSSPVSLVSNTYVFVPKRCGTSSDLAIDHIPGKAAIMVANYMTIDGELDTTITPLTMRTAKPYDYTIGPRAMCGGLTVLITGWRGSSLGRSEERRVGKECRSRV